MDLSCIIQSGDLELYVMGMLPPEEAGKVEALAQLFPEIQQELDVIAATFEAGAMQMAVTPSSSVKEKMMSSLSSQHPTTLNETSATVVTMKPVIETRSSFSKLAIAASWGLLILLGGLSVYLFTSNQQLKNDVAGMQQNASGYERQMTEMNQQLSAYETYRRLKNDVSVTSVALTSVTDAVQQKAEVFWNKTTGELYIDPTLLPKTPTGQQYQLWFILDGKPVDAGMISQTDKAFLQKMKECKAAQAFAITLEKEGGNPTPEGKMMVMGKVS